MNTPFPLLSQARRMPLVAILRGLVPAEAAAIGSALYEGGFRALEVPLNRPGAIECIDVLTRALPADALIGGGTILTLADVDAVRSAGGRLFVSPNCDVRVIAHAASLGMLCAPGVVTPTEAFAALQAGAHALKLFPADIVGHSGLKALLSVVPAGTDFWPVGGVTPESMGPWVKAGAAGFGIGGQLFSPGITAAKVGVKARAYLQAWEASQRPA
jgi:2-dehydro-3-deoxyphosphogalactonate aldolase